MDTPRGRPLRFEILAQDAATGARAGVLHTRHGPVETPAFMPVGTIGTVKAMTQDQLEQLGVQILLANAYHLYLRPGYETIRDLGGLHPFMGWSRPILTDSGGFQVMSLRGLSRITEDGVSFRSHLDGSPLFLSPERVVEVQLALGADIIMCLDECVEYPSSQQTCRRAMKRTGRWARRSKEFYLAQARGLEGWDSGKKNSSFANPEPRTLDPEVWSRDPEGRAPALFGILQGGTDKALRRESAEEIAGIGFEGYALGGLAVGEPKGEMYDIAEHVAALLPTDCPRYLMGVGTPRDLVECVARGIDLFDCVLPTRNARNGSVFTSEGKLVIKGARYARDEAPLDPACACSVCRRYTRSYIRHLFGVGEMLAAILATHHNLHFYLDTMRKIRQAIRSAEFNEFLSRVRARL